MATTSYRITPDRITILQPGQIFVFGSNAQGMHAGGAARFALDHFGAEWGQGEGLQGQSYAIPTMEGLDSLKLAVDRFIAASTQSLVEEFNRQVGNSGWTSARANHDQALISEFQNRGIDTSAVYDGQSIDFGRCIRLDEAAGILLN